MQKDAKTPMMTKPRFSKTIFVVLLTKKNATGYAATIAYIHQGAEAELTIVS